MVPTLKLLAAPFFPWKALVFFAQWNKKNLLWLNTMASESTPLMALSSLSPSDPSYTPSPTLEHISRDIIWCQCREHQRLSINFFHVFILFSINITINLLYLLPILMLVFWQHCHFTKTWAMFPVVGGEIFCEVTGTENRTKRGQ